MTRSTRVLLIILGYGSLLVAAGAALVIYEVWPYVKARDYLPNLERSSAALIAAIDHYETDHTRPPETLDVLVPKYIAVVPATGYRPQQEFSYAVYERPGGSWSWELFVFCGDPLDFIGSRSLCYSSERRVWRHSLD